MVGIAEDPWSLDDVAALIGILQGKANNLRQKRSRVNFRADPEYQSVMQSLTLCLRIRADALAERAALWSQA
jgi:hypothetical protein